MKKLIKRLLCAAGGLLFALAGVEASLRFAGYLQVSRIISDVKSVDPNRPIVIFCGDSNIYGVYVEPHETLPRAVERITQKNGTPAVRCFNFGAPGSASWNVLEQVKSALYLKPAAVFVRCGINNLSLKPPDGTLGFLEQFNIVKLIRFYQFNSEIKRAQLHVTKLKVGPGENEIDSFHVAVSPEKGVVSVVDREGRNVAWDKITIPNATLRDAEPRLLADLQEMARMVKKSGAAFYYLTPALDDISAVLREAARRENVGIIESGEIIKSSIQFGDSRPASQWPWELLESRTAAFLTQDRHFTALGYEVEARAVAAELKQLKITPDYVPEDPLAVARDYKIPIPNITIEPKADTPKGFVDFKIETRANGRIIMFAGPKGNTTFRNLTIPLDAAPFEAARARFAIATLIGTADKNGEARFVLPAELLRSLPRPLYAIAILETGGSGGSAQRFPSAPFEIDAEKYF
ncbi:MAG: hypothetical protein ACKVS6_10950 [Planctomycetota bacterium]